MTESVDVWNSHVRSSPWRQVGGWFLLVVGIAGLALPILPGAPLLIAGLVMLSPDYQWARTLLRRVKLWIRTLNRRRSRLVSSFRS